MPDEVGLHVDHIVPISKGGKTILLIFKYYVLSVMEANRINNVLKLFCLNVKIHCL